MRKQVSNTLVSDELLGTTGKPGKNCCKSTREHLTDIAVALQVTLCYLLCCGTDNGVEIWSKIMVPHYAHAEGARLVLVYLRAKHCKVSTLPDTSHHAALGPGLDGTTTTSTDCKTPYSQFEPSSSSPTFTQLVLQLRCPQEVGYLCMRPHRSAC